MSEPTLATLKDLVTEARYFVDHFKPQTQEEYAARESLLLRIDQTIPPPAAELIARAKD